jgi:hypothetical protein
MADKLTAAQKKKWDKIRRNKGKAAAKAYRDGIIADSGGGTQPPDPPPGTPPPIEDLSKQGQKTTRRESELSDISNIISNKDLDAGILLGDKLAPDITSGEFLDRVEHDRRAEVDKVVGNFDADRQRALTDSEELKFALDSLKQRSQEGFTLQEKEARGLNARTSTNQALQSGLRAAQAFNTGRGIKGGFGASAFNPAIVQAIQSRRGLENDIMLAEINEKARALTEFSGLTERRDQNRSSNLLNINTGQGNLLEQDALLQTDIGKFNAGQRAKEIAARTAKNATGLGIIQDQSDILREDQASRDAVKASQKSLDELLSFAS